MSKCTCHERDSSQTCDYCHKEGFFGHMEDHLRADYWQEKAEEYEEKIKELSILLRTGSVLIEKCEKEIKKLRKWLNMDD